MRNPTSSTQQHPAAPAAIAINSAQVAASVKGQRGKCDRRNNAPRAPRGKAATQSASWRRYYANKAAYYQEMHECFSNNKALSFAAKHTAAERERFLEGVRQIDAGQHPNQIAGVWI